MEDNRFEKNVAEEMGSFKLKPSDAVWQQVDAQLKEDRKRRRWIIIFLFTGLLLGGAGLLYVTADKNEHASTALHSSANTITTAEERKKQTDQNNASTVNNQPNDNQTKKSSTTEPTATGVPVKTEEPESNIQQPVVTISLKKNKTVAASKLVSTVQVAQTKRQNKLVITQEDKTVVAAVKQEENSVVDATPLTEPKMEVKAISVAVKDSVEKVTADSVSTSAMPVPADSIAKPESKWRWGLQLNTGIAQIRDNVFPGGMSVVADAPPLTGNNVGTGGPTRITINQFAIKPSLQFGIGIVARKTVFKKHAFVTGLQYQYSSYKVEQRQRIDSFYQTSNSFSTLMLNNSAAAFKTHSVAVPLDLEWKIASTAKGLFRLGTGLQQWFTLSSLKKGTLASSFRYDGATTTSLASGNRTVTKTTWQPVLQLAPVYEWGLQKQTAQLGLYFNYGLRPVYKTSASDYWWQTGVRYRIYFK